VIAAEEVEPGLAAGGSGDDLLDHIWCCDPDRALCGADLSGVEEVDSIRPDRACVVCLDIDRQPGPVCPLCHE
jgi:hypothetical protein